MIDWEHIQWLFLTPCIQFFFKSKNLKITYKVFFLKIRDNCLLLFRHEVVWLFVTPWTVARQGSLPFTISQSLLLEEKWKKNITTWKLQPEEFIWNQKARQPLNLCFLFVNWNILDKSLTSLYLSSFTVLKGFCEKQSEMRWIPNTNTPFQAVDALTQLLRTLMNRPLPRPGASPIPLSQYVLWCQTVTLCPDTLPLPCLTQQQMPPRPSPDSDPALPEQTVHSLTLDAPTRSLCWLQLWDCALVADQWPLAQSHAFGQGKGYGK